MDVAGGFVSWAPAGVVAPGRPNPAMLASERMTDLRRSPCHDRHVALGAKLADFGGWEMPIEYPGGGVVKEHTAVRESVGLFDVSHLGKAEVRGPGAAAFVNSTLSNDLGRIGPGKAQYTLCCDEASGGVVDDLIAYYVAEDDVFLIPNAANTAEVVRRLRDAAPDGIEVHDLHEDFGVLAVQGPRSDEVLEKLGLPTGSNGLDHEALGYMSFVRATWEGRPVTVCRTGYTGERGYELVPRWEDAPALWDAILAAGEPVGIRPCGSWRARHVAHRDGLSAARPGPVARHHPGAGTLRLGGRLEEAAVLGTRRAGRREGGGRPPAALGTGRVSSAPSRVRTCRSARASSGEAVGEVTSGTFSPTKKVGIALALLDRSVAEGDEVSVDVRGRPARFQVVKPPFVEASTSG